MVQMFNVGPSRSQHLKNTLGKFLNEGVGSFATGFAANKSLNKVLEDSEYKNAEPSEKASRLVQALSPYGEYGKNILAQRMAIEQQKEQEGQQKVLSKMLAGEQISPREAEKLPPEIQFKYQEQQNKKKQLKNIRGAMKKAGVPEEMIDPISDLYENAPTGGQTDIIKGVNDLIRRAKKGDFKEIEEKKEATNEGDFEWPEISEPEGLLPREEVALTSENRKHNLPLYEDVNKKLFGLEDEERDIQRLTQLNDRRNLPEGIEKWNVNWETGEPRAAALLHPDAQLYIKTIANMFGKAKEFFPGRVTNFDLENFKKRFPTLANSFEGRQLIAKQLELANKIAYLKEETYKKAIEHYGAGADPVLLRKYSNENYKKLKKDLEERLKNLDGLLEQKYEEQKSSDETNSGKNSLEGIFG